MDQLVYVCNEQNGNLENAWILVNQLLIYKDAFDILFAYCVLYLYMRSILVTSPLILRLLCRQQFQSYLFALYLLVVFWGFKQVWFCLAFFFWPAVRELNSAFRECLHTIENINKNISFVFIFLLFLNTVSVEVVVSFCLLCKCRSKKLIQMQFTMNSNKVSELKAIEPNVLYCIL